MRGSAFIEMCKFHDIADLSRSRPGRLVGWNRPITNVLPNEFMMTNPAYRHAMITLAELFISLGELFPTSGCVQVLDLIPGETHHDLAAVYRLMSKACEVWPAGNVQPFLSPGSRTPERLRREIEYREQLHRKRSNVRLPDREEYWLQLAIKELEQSAGREHPDTLDALQNLVRRDGDPRGRKKRSQPFAMPGAGLSSCRTECYPACPKFKPTSSSKTTGRRPT